MRRLVVACVVAACGASVRPGIPHPGGHANSHVPPSDPEQEKKLCNASIGHWSSVLGVSSLNPTETTWESRTPVYLRSRACAQAGFEVMKAPLGGQPDPNMYTFDVGGAVRFLKRACNDGEAISALISTADFQKNPRNITEAEALEYAALSCTALHDLTLAGLVAMDRDAIDAKVCRYAHDARLTTPRSGAVTKEACGVWNVFSSVLPSQWLTGEWTNRAPIADIDVDDSEVGVLPGELARLQSAAPGELGDDTWALLDTGLSFVDPGSLDTDALTTALAPHVDALLATAAAHHDYLAVELKLPNVISALQRFEVPEMRAILAHIKSFEDNGADIYAAAAAMTPARYPGTRTYYQLAAMRMRHDYTRLAIRVTKPPTVASSTCGLVSGVLEGQSAPVIDVPVDLDFTVTTCRDDSRRWVTSETYEYQETVYDGGGGGGDPTQTRVVTQEISHTGANDWSHYSSGESVKYSTSSSSSSSGGGGGGSHLETRTGTRDVQHLALDLELDVTIHAAQGTISLAADRFVRPDHREDTSYHTPHGSKDMTLEPLKVDTEMRQAFKQDVEEVVSRAGASLAVTEGAVAEKRGDMAAAEDAYARAVLLGSRDGRAVEVVTKKFGGVFGKAF